ncbi:MAG: hypothetical protein GY895_04910 [Phycisphaera sp.]|nr:hypothetical protein [Phycisphaera sp.]
MTDGTTPLPIARDEDGIVTLTLTPNPNRPRGGVVVLDAWLLDAIDVTIDAVLEGPDPNGFILASGSERVFVAGADLAEIDALDDAALLGYLSRGAEVYQRIAAMPCPSVAAINGACLGGGLEIAMHCDVLIGSLVGAEEKPWRIGLPEAGLGLCPGWGGTQMLPGRIDPSIAIPATCTGTTFKATEVPDGLLETMVPKRELATAAAAWIRGHPEAHADRRGRATPMAIDDRNRAAVTTGLDAVRAQLDDSPSTRAVVECLEVGLEHGWAAAIAAERRLLTELRNTPEAREKLEQFLARA